MKKRSILTVLMALFLVLLISCADSNTGGGSDNDDTGDNGGGGSGTGGLNYTPELEEDNESTFNLGYYIRGDGRQDEFFSKCEVMGEYSLEKFAVFCSSDESYLPYTYPNKLEILPHATKTVKHTMTNDNENMAVCFGSVSLGCNLTIDQQPSSIDEDSLSISIQINPDKLDELKINKTPEIFGSFSVSNNNTNITKKYYYKLKLVDAVTPDCIDGLIANDPNYPNELTCKTPEELNGKLVLTDTTSLAGLNIWDMLTKGAEVGTFTNLKIKFEEGFLDIFTIDTKTTCSIKNSIVSIDKNCEIFVSKKQGVTGEKTLTITGTAHFYDHNVRPPTPLPAVPINATYTFIAE